MLDDPETVTLTRDVVAILIPAGTKVELPEGASALITQALGGSFTIQVQGHLFRIGGSDADALGKQVVRGPDVNENASDEELEKAVWAQLRTCYDPEIPIDIVELGLVYESRLEPVDPDNAGGPRKAVIRMTLTAPGCGMGDVLVNDVKTKVLQVPMVTEADVELTFDPPWSRDMMSEAAQLQVGMY
ncbi:MAG: sufT [Hydrocarboniphaga sp.]|uniref:putative Fe-S cluster assembly protein SufT n=1 Tax=Hydrocarboniphaga sp. TaxID=2033016 RepID=UPI002609C818|nr:putative Fe-S cluster assembly protein SufT [Hydrocarboniphaga sp.]MDB5968583.1 sufT [Hydrocarboniphaga sp.]